MNPILQSSPIQTWSLLSQRTQGVVRIFTCTDAPLAPSEHVAGRWVFESHSQFARLLTCLQFIEPNLAQPRHTSYLRLRPDSLVLGGLPPFVLNRPHPDAVYARWRYYDHSHVRGSFGILWNAGRATNGANAHSASTDRCSFTPTAATAAFRLTEHFSSAEVRCSQSYARFGITVNPMVTRRAAPNCRAIIASMSVGWSRPVLVGCWRTRG